MKFILGNNRLITRVSSGSLPSVRYSTDSGVALKASMESKAHEERRSQDTSVMKRIMQWPVHTFSALYGRPAMLLFKGLSTSGNNVLYGIKLLLLSAREGKIRRRADIWHFSRLRRDIPISTPYFFLIPGCMFLPAVPLICKYVPAAVPTTFHTAQVLDFKLASDSTNRRAVYSTLQRQLTVTLFNRFVLDESVKQRLLQLVLASESRQSAILELNELMKQHKLPLEVAVWSQLVLSLLVTESQSMYSVKSLNMVAKLLPLFLQSGSSAPFSIFDDYKLCTLAGQAVGIRFAKFMSRTRLYSWADWMLKDDQLVRNEGVSSLTHYELIEALAMRGYVDLYTTTSISYLQQLLSSHVKFTQSVSRTLVIHRRAADSAPSGVLDKYSHGLEPVEVSIVGTLVMFCRIFSITK